jgi:hypothetical protein
MEDLTSLHSFMAFVQNPDASAVPDMAVSHAPTPSRIFSNQSDICTHAHMLILAHMHTCTMSPSRSTTGQPRTIFSDRRGRLAKLPGAEDMVGAKPGQWSAVGTWRVLSFPPSPK